MEGASQWRRRQHLFTFLRHPHPVSDMMTAFTERAMPTFELQAWPSSNPNAESIQVVEPSRGIRAAPAQDLAGNISSDLPKESQDFAPQRRVLIWLINLRLSVSGGRMQVNLTCLASHPGVLCATYCWDQASGTIASWVCRRGWSAVSGAFLLAAATATTMVTRMVTATTR